jgi:integrase
MRLTDAYIRNLRFDGNKIAHFDDALPNFGARVYKSGISFIVMIGNSRKLKTIGRYPEMSLKEARTEALRLLSDTKAPKPTKLASEALIAFLADCEGKNRPRTVKDYRRLLRSFPSGKMAEIGRIALLDAISRFRDTPAEQSHVTTAFQIFLNWCVHNGYLETNPIAGLRNQGRINKRARVLADDELKAITLALGQTIPDNIVKMLILYGQRITETQHITVSGSVGTIDANHTKNGKAHTFPVITVYPVERYKGWSKYKKQLDAKCGVSDWTFHDLRRTFATNLARLGTPIHVTEKLLNHISGTHGGITGIYQRHQYWDEQVEAIQRYHDWLFSLCPGFAT